MLCFFVSVSVSVSISLTTVIRLIQYNVTNCQIVSINRNHIVCVLIAIVVVVVYLVYFVSAVKIPGVKRKSLMC